mmetsp:Transcript_29999/g.72036  ORF Transcript_29999/g.72036 Transcript_29999/m.72036 type:complete len:312 (+) Transcript_29999:302-1237(+)
MITYNQLIISFFASLLGGATLLSLAVWKDKRYYHSFVQYMIGLTIMLNVRYFTEGPTQGIAFFVGIYDVLHNLAAGPNPNATAALIPCYPDDPACSVMEGYYDYHPKWGVAFHHRFQFAPAWRTQLLLVHIACNTLAFCLMTLQIYVPAKRGAAQGGGKKENQQHRVLGRIASGSLVVGVLSACLLSLEHGSVDDYGGKMATYGFNLMGIFVLLPAFMGMRAIIVDRNVPAHARWMFRCAGSMWGAFWIFRGMELVLGPLLTNFHVLSIQLCVWCSAPIGLAIAEAILRSRGNFLLKAETPAATAGIKKQA